MSLPPPWQPAPCRWLSAAITAWPWAPGAVSPGAPLPQASPYPA